MFPRSWMRVWHRALEDGTLVSYPSADDLNNSDPFSPREPLTPCNGDGIARPDFALGVRKFFGAIVCRRAVRWGRIRHVRTATR
jgi:hypothetical protein